MTDPSRGGAPVTRRPPGWYAQLYRRTYGDRAPETGARTGVPMLIWVGAALVVGGIFLPWVRGGLGWIAAFTAFDVPLRGLWRDPFTGGWVPGRSGLVNAVTGLSVAFCAAVLTIAAIVSAFGRLPSWVRIVAALGIIAMPTALVVELARAASEHDVGFLSVVGPGLLCMAAGGALIGLARIPRSTP